MILILVISMAFLVLIALSDIKSRQIPIIYLLGESIASFSLSYNLIGTSIVKSAITNFGIIAFQILMLWVWIKTKEGNKEISLWSKFGKGDLFILAISAINLSALNYLFFTIFVSIATIIIWAVFSLLRKIKDQTIPFAGFLAAGLMVLRILQLTGYGVNFNSDNLILNLIYGIY
jgi:hypothetical protein